jgi:hypothetical protein
VVAIGVALLSLGVTTYQQFLKRRTAATSDRWFDGPTIARDLKRGVG